MYYQEKQFHKAFEVLKTTNVNTSSKRYKKTVMALMKTGFYTLLNSEEHTLEFKNTITRNQNNYSYYQQQLTYAIENNMTLTKLFQALNSVNNK